MSNPACSRFTFYANIHSLIGGPFARVHQIRSRYMKIYSAFSACKGQISNFTTEPRSRTLTTFPSTTYFLSLVEGWHPCGGEEQLGFKDGLSLRGWGSSGTRQKGCLRPCVSLSSLHLQAVRIPSQRPEVKRSLLAEYPTRTPIRTGEGTYRATGWLHFCPREGAGIGCVGIRTCRGRGVVCAPFVP